MTILAMLTILLFLIGGLLLFFIVIVTKSWKHEAIIARQIGPEPGDVVFLKDKFKVKTQGDYFTLQFRKQFKSKTPSPKRSLWQRFFRGSANAYDNQHKFSDKRLKKLFREGALFYQSTEGELKPMQIKDYGTLTVLDQDNRAFIAQDIEREKQFTTSTKDRILQVAMWVAPLFIAALVFVFVIIWSGQVSTDNIASLCGQAAQAAGNSGLVDQVQGVVGG